MEGNIGFIGFGNMAQAIARGLTLTAESERPMGSLNG